ncbi:Kelch repeat-containing protein [Brevundimonas sp. VNH65]|uniref:Kelch repeat-containing protein n=1 Tax=Brevundimonas sp. VNH65 TaxID=3400917 RepID=UPI003BFD9559
MTSLTRRMMLAATAATPLTIVAGAARARAGGAWTARAPMPAVAQEIYAARQGPLIYTAGGLVGRPGGLFINDDCFVYDARRDEWTGGPRLPEPRHHLMLVDGPGDRIWGFGGYDRRDGGEWTAMTQVWVIDQGRWHEVGRMPSPLCETVGLHHDGLIHLATGRSPKGEANGQWNDQGDVDTHLIFDPADLKWTTGRPCPMARNSAAGAVLDGALWIAGGRTVTGGGTGRLDRYDPVADRWDTLAPIPVSPRTGKQVGGGLALAAARGRLVAFGGEWFAPRSEGGGGGVFAETWIYDPARDAWTESAPMTTPRHGLAAVTIDDVVYALGGGEVVSGGAASERTEAFRFEG